MYLDSILEVVELVAQGLLCASMGSSTCLSFCPRALSCLQLPAAALQPCQLSLQLLHSPSASTKGKYDMSCCRDAVQGSICCQYDMSCSSSSMLCQASFRLVAPGLFTSTITQLLTVSDQHLLELGLQLDGLSSDSTPSVQLLSVLLHRITLHDIISLTVPQSQTESLCSAVRLLAHLSASTARRSVASASLCDLYSWCRSCLALL